MRSLSRISIIAGFAAIAACASQQNPPPAQCVKDYAAIKAAEMAVIDEGMRIYAEVGENPQAPEQLAALETLTTLLESRSRPVDKADIAIIDRAKEILSSEAVWDREDDRVCEETDATFSLFCALRFASVDVIGEYQHRRTALQEVRFALEDATADREYEHRLRDFNNDPSTTLEDVYAVLDVARTRMVARLELQKACAL